MATFRLHDPRSSRASAMAHAFWVNALTQERARAILATAFEPNDVHASRWLDSARTACLLDRCEAVPHGVISIGSISCGE